MRRQANAPRVALERRITEVCHLAVRTRAKRNGGTCPVKPGNPVEDACHIIRKARGKAVRWEPLNIYGGSKAANVGEHYHPLKYLEIHKQVFGKELVERLEVRSRETVKFMVDDLRLMLAFWEHRLEWALFDTIPPHPAELELRARGLIL